jgi:hypothetical protein
LKNVGAEHWPARSQAERAEVDPLTVAINSRLARLVPAFESCRGAALASIALTPEMYDLVVSLLRPGDPRKLSAGAGRDFDDRLKLTEACLESLAGNGRTSLAHLLQKLLAVLEV